MRTVPFGNALDFVATKMLGTRAPMVDEARAYVGYLNDAVRLCWEREFWPELMGIEERYYRPEWDAGTTYPEDSEVYYLVDDVPIYYRALRETVNDQPDVSTDDWEVATDLLRYVTLDGEVAAGVTPPSPAIHALDDLILTVAQLTALTLTSANAGTQRLVYDATYGTGIYRLRTGTDATAAPTIYRPDNYAGLAVKIVWEKVT